MRERWMKNLNYLLLKNMGTGVGGCNKRDRRRARGACVIDSPYRAAEADRDAADRQLEETEMEVGRLRSMLAGSGLYEPASFEHIDGGGMAEPGSGGHIAAVGSLGGRLWRRAARGG